MFDPSGPPSSGNAAGGLLRSWALLEPIRIRLNPQEQIIIVSSMDSDLEAFSRNPSDGSFSPLTFQSSEMTNYHI